MLIAIAQFLTDDFVSSAQSQSFSNRTSKPIGTEHIIKIRAESLPIDCFIHEQSFSMTKDPDLTTRKAMTTRKPIVR